MLPALPEVGAVGGPGHGAVADDRRCSRSGLRTRRWSPRAPSVATRSPATTSRPRRRSSRRRRSRAATRRSSRPPCSRSRSGTRSRSAGACCRPPRAVPSTRCRRWWWRRSPCVRPAGAGSGPATPTAQQRRALAHDTAPSSTGAARRRLPDHQGRALGFAEDVRGRVEAGCPVSAQPDAVTATAARRRDRPPPLRRGRRCRGTERGSTAGRQ